MIENQGAQLSTPPIPRALESVHKQLQAAQALLAQLEARLEPVMTPQPPEVGANKAGAGLIHAARSHILDSIDNTGSQIEAIATRLDAIISRLQV